MGSRAAWIGSAVALSASMVVGLGLGTASAGSSEPCGAVTKRAACEPVGAIGGGVYQVKFTLPDAANEASIALCKGGPSRSDRDTALSDNLLQYLLSASLSPDTRIERVEDSKGRLVGYKAVGEFTLSNNTIDLFVTCIDDR